MFVLSCFLTLCYCNIQFIVRLLPLNMHRKKKSLFCFWFLFFFVSNNLNFHLFTFKHQFQIVVLKYKIHLHSVFVFFHIDFIWKFALFLWVLILSITHLWAHLVYFHFITFWVNVSLIFFFACFVLGNCVRLYVLSFLRLFFFYFFIYSFIQTLSI